MAQSKLERVGTIFSRLSSIILGGGMQEHNIPIWYNVYKAFPPKYEPRFNRPASQKPLRNIFYDEDVVRAKFHEDIKNLPRVNLNSKTKTVTATFLNLYTQFQKDGLNPEGAYEAALIRYTSMHSSKNRTNRVENFNDSDVVLPQLLEWIKFHFPSTEHMASKILAQKALGAELKHANYWETVIRCVLHGKLDSVQALLSLHSKVDHPAFVTADNILKTMPMYNAFGSYSVNEFIMRWKHWQLDLCANISSKVFIIDASLEMTMKLIAGEQEVLWQLSSYTDAWYELLAAKLLYTCPCCKQPELAYHANSISKRWQANRPSDNAIRALMESDLHQVIREIQYMGDNGWFATHLVDLLYTCGRLKILDRDQIEVTRQLHESLILEYGNTLMGHHSLWQCGASYLIHCSIQGLARLELLIQSLPMGSEARVNKIIDMACTNKMDHVVTSVCKIQGIKCIKQGRLGNALAWALKAQDSSFITYIADQFLKQYAETGKLECRDLLENLGFCMMASDRLTFLGKYCEFHQMYGIGEYKEAASLLVSLLVSNLTPKYFWSILLSDAIPLLEAKDVILSSSDCYELLRCVEAHGHDTKFQDEIEIFRLAVARNLARALSLEGCQVEH
ncbi:Nuclear pore complex protein Nup85 [Dufourea novaeangliae]|uniref:Nuclear pore complex protein Nup85 n=1 Tax=Dufourea novaeangliae TaxID=178035 RepID=A0A154NY12_DUFNO|nr:Nuclear pore complex protein Nup85 [Dufourea novaeangliae]